MAVLNGFGLFLGPGLRHVRAIHGTTARATRRPQELEVTMWRRVAERANVGIDAPL